MIQAASRQAKTDDSDTRNLSAITYAEEIGPVIKGHEKLQLVLKA
jgi:hypothetical protein